MIPRISYIRLAIFLALSLSLLTSFKEKAQPPHMQVASYYDARLDSLQVTLQLLQQRITAGVSADSLKATFRSCRGAYKKAGFFIQYLDTRSARLLNGPDLLRIEEENPADSIKPHGLQVMERCLYGGDIADTVTLVAETKSMLRLTERLRQDPDRKYLFTDAAIWSALRTGIYGIIALDITGFDAPLSKESSAGAIATLESMSIVIVFYQQGAVAGDAKLFSGAQQHIRASLKMLRAQPEFNKIDRLALIRTGLNPSSASLSAIARSRGYDASTGRTALNMKAAHLFSRNVFNTDFFSPNSQYLPTAQRVALGRRLFYDTRLSGGASRSCGSCHRPARAFTDGLIKPLRIAGGTLLRNTPTLLNAALQTRQFYDLRTDKMENQLSEVVHNADEMGGSLKDAVGWMERDTSYSSAFKQAYPAEQASISPYNIANAISSYVRSLISFNAPFDRYMRHETATYTQAARHGFNLFMGKGGCGTCHYAPLFNGLVPPLYGDTEAEVLGVPADTSMISVVDPDEGKSRFTKISLHRHAFKTPTLRNVALTAPYMHNGAFRTLDQVLGFYNDGGGAGRGIQLSNQTLPAQPLKLTRGEMQDVIAFLRTLTDTAAANH